MFRSVNRTAKINKKSTPSKLHFEPPPLIPYFASPNSIFMTWTQYLLPLLLSGFTGWLVVVLILKLLFHPYKPRSIAGFKIQGIIPANQQALAEKIGILVSTELFSIEELKEKIIQPRNFERLKPEMEAHIDGFLRVRLKESFPMISMLIGDKTINQLKSAFLTELESLFPVVMKSYMDKLEQELDLESQVTQKIAGFSIIKAEQLVNRSAKKAFLRMQIAGAILGLMMGMLHILLNAQLFA